MLLTIVPLIIYRIESHVSEKAQAETGRKSFIEYHFVCLRHFKRTRRVLHGMSSRLFPLAVRVSRPAGSLQRKQREQK